MSQMFLLRRLRHVTKKTPIDRSKHKDIQKFINVTAVDRCPDKDGWLTADNEHLGLAFLQHLDNKYDEMEPCIGVIVAYLPEEAMDAKVDQSGSPIDLFNSVFVDCNSCEDTSRFQVADFLKLKKNFKWIPQEVAFQVAKYGVTNRPIYWQDKLHVNTCARWNLYLVAKAKVSTPTKRTKALAGTGKAGHKKPTRLSPSKKKAVDSNDSEYNPSGTSSYIIMLHHIKYR